MDRRLQSVTVITLLFLATTAAGAPEAEPWPFWQPSDEQNAAVIDHADWAAFLERYLVTDNADGIHRVRYSAVDEDGYRLLAGYLDQLQSADPRGFRRNEQKAYWINLYNAATIKVVLDNPAKKSILRMGERFFSIGPWDDVLLDVAGQPLTLNDIEHRILRPIWQDRRIHYAVNCASIGCPNLTVRPYTGDTLHEMLDENEHDYINHSRGVSLKEGRLTLSQIYKWYLDDFAPDQAGLLAYLAEHADVDLARGLRGWKGKLRYDYDWDLNTAPD